jgi:hypothetical protein
MRGSISSDDDGSILDVAPGGRVNSSAHSVTSSISMSTSKADVFARLSSSKQYVHDVLSQIKQDMELAQCTFKPNISNSATIITEKNSPKLVLMTINADLI